MEAAHGTWTIMNILLAVDGPDHTWRLVAQSPIVRRRRAARSKVFRSSSWPLTPIRETRSRPDSDYSRLESAAMKQVCIAPGSLDTLSSIHHAAGVRNAARA